MVFGCAENNDTDGVYMKTYIPKGSMCKKCRHKHDDCSLLDFKAMPKHIVTDGIVVVICKVFGYPDKNRNK